MADNATLFKHTARLTGLQYGITPTFMAKPYGDQPGCSGHVHISLKDKEGRNIFAVSKEDLKDGRKDALYEDTKRISKEAEWFLAGILEGLPDIVRTLFSSRLASRRRVLPDEKRSSTSLPTLLSCRCLVLSRPSTGPSFHPLLQLHFPPPRFRFRFLFPPLHPDSDCLFCLHSYKRLVESYWAPTSVSYAYENRVASVRIIAPPLADPAATRLEVVRLQILLLSLLLAVTAATLADPYCLG